MMEECILGAFDSYVKSFDVSVSHILQLFRELVFMFALNNTLICYCRASVFLVKNKNVSTALEYAQGI